MVRSHKKGVVLALLSGILWASYSVTLYSWLSPYNGDSGTLDSARGIMFIILAASRGSTRLSPLYSSLAM